MEWQTVELDSRAYFVCLKDAMRSGDKELAIKYCSYLLEVLKDELSKSS